MKNQGKKANKWNFCGLQIDPISWSATVIAYFALAVILSIYLINFGIPSGFKFSDSQEAWAHFGDYFGGAAGPFIGFASIMLLVATLHSQRSELKEQREQIALQAFEQSLFSWLKNYKDQLSEVEDISSGRCRLYALRKWYEDNFSNFQASHIYRQDEAGQYVPILENPAFPNYLKLFEGIQRGDSTAREVLNIRLQSAVDSFNELAHESQRDVFESLFRSLYRLFLWIDQSSLTNEQKWHYTSLVRAQLSWIELVYMTYNGLTKHGEKFSKLINKYALLDNLTPSDNDLLWAFRWVFTELPPNLPGDPSEPYKRRWPYTLAAFDSDLAKNELRLTKQLP